MTEHSSEIQRLLDRQEILDCINRYGRALDRHDNDLLFSVFHEDAIDNHGDFFGSIRDFVEWSAELHVTEPWSAHTHFMDCRSIDIDGDEAHAETYVLFVHRREDNSVIEFGGGRYIDRFERRDGKWKIAARQLLIEWTATADQAKFADVASYPHGSHDRSDPSYRRPFTLQAKEKG